MIVRWCVVGRSSRCLLVCVNCRCGERFVVVLGFLLVLFLVWCWLLGWDVMKLVLVGVKFGMDGLMGRVLEVGCGD